jgi:para-aminobenzoate synthetase component 1
VSLVRRELIPMPLDVDPRELAARVGSLRFPAILESGAGFPHDGRWSIYAAEPIARFVSPDGVRARIQQLEPRAARRTSSATGRGSAGTMFERLARWMDELGIDVHGEAPGSEEPPFRGGLMGCLSYDLAPAIERLPRRHPGNGVVPAVLLQLYDTFITHDRLTDRVVLWSANDGVSSPRAARQRLHRWKKSLTDSHASETRRGPLKPEVPGPLTSNFSREDYLNAVKRAIDYIRAGDIFQVNLSQRYRAEMTVDGLALFLALREQSPAPFAAFLDLGGGNQVVSTSPEWFYQTRGSRIVTRPIKGTRPRGASPAEDRLLKLDLGRSAKDRAELTMIIDLERNDLGRVCEYGSVRVVDPFVIESFASVHHLVATIEGVLRPEINAADVVRALFPGGSITGAPKIRAMEIIDELERCRRSIYTGAIGYWSHGASATNIAIRTVLVEPRAVSFQVGGGIVADSDPLAEYEETLAKGRLIQQTLTAWGRSS